MKKWLIAAGILLAAGLIILTAGLSLIGFDLTKLGTREMITNTYTVEESFENISVDAITADILFAPSEDGGVKVVCYEDKKVPFRVRVEEDTLVISCEDNRKWYDHIGIFWETETVTVYLPAGEYAQLQVNCTTGNVTAPEALSFANVQIDVTTGDICWKAGVSQALSVKTTTGAVTAEKVQCSTLHVKTTTGDVTLTDVLAEETIRVQVSTGDVKLKRVDAGELEIKSTTGDVTGTLLSEKVFITEVTTGDVRVPATTSGGECRIETTTGNIHITIE